MNWKQWLAFVGQHALQGAIIAGAGLGAAGLTPVSKEGVSVMLSGAIVAAANHLRQKPTDPPKE